jgi:tol-pal system protein YbgF
MTSEIGMHRLLAAALLGGALSLIGVGQFGPAWAQSVVAPVTVDPAITRLQDRLDELERQLRLATGENERLQRERDLARADVVRLEKEVNDLLAQQSAQPSPFVAVRPADPPPKPAPKALAPPPADPAPAPSVTTPAAGPTAPGPAAAAGDAAGAYKAIRTQLMRGDAAGAEAGLRQWIATYPDDAQTPEAKYWLGQTLLGRSANDEAAKVFVDLLRAHPNAPIAADTMGRLGVALTRMGQKSKGCAAFKDVPRRYPNAGAARARAAEEAQKAGCPAG